jgi:NitT/TauT family transport system substrate-binding protein
MESINDWSRDATTRRRFLINGTALGAAALIPFPVAGATEPPPEIRKIRLSHVPAICLAPQYLVEDLLHLEGFAEVEYVKLTDIGSPDALADDRTDFGMWDAYSVLPYLDRGKPFLVVAGIHAGCYQLFAKGAIRSIRDLKGTTIAVYELGQGAHVLVASMLAYVGMDPGRDVRWVSGDRPEDAVRLFEAGKADAFIGFPPHPQELLARKVGHVILDTSRDRPWSQYFCCMLLANRRFTASYPAATRRVLRAFLKAADICALEPDRAARLLVDRGFEPRYEIAHETLKGVSYRRWREANPEDTLRFYGLRLFEVGMIKTNPNALIAQGTDWSFLNALKREMRA